MHPEKVTELAAAWEDAAWHNTIFPLLEPVARKSGGPVRRSPARYGSSRNPVLEHYRSAQLMQYRDFTIDAELGGYSQGDEWVLVARRRHAGAGRFASPPETATAGAGLRPQDGV